MGELTLVWLIELASLLGQFLEKSFYTIAQSELNCKGGLIHLKRSSPKKPASPSHTTLQKASVPS